MSDSNQNDPAGAQQSPDPGEVVKELRNLGKNLKDVFETAWDSPERKRVQKEIEVGLNELSATLSQVATDLHDSPARQRIKDDLEDFKQRVRSGEVEAKIQSELLAALRAANAELEKATRRNPPSPPPNPE
jgi:hypothetical protein